MPPQSSPPTSSYLDITNQTFTPQFHYQDTCPSPTLMLETLTRILNDHHKGTPQSFPSFYLYTLHQPNRLVPWSPHEAHQPLAVIDLTGGSLRGGHYGSASIYLMHPTLPKRTVLTSFCYLFVKEIIRRGEDRVQTGALGKLRTRTTGLDEGLDAAVTEVREYWLRADLVGDRYLVTGVRREDRPHAIGCLTLKYQGACFWAPMPRG
ncbi:hypothetical protein BDV23DRAFT_180733 [Aspergillus alliaceus]|uniref:Uncharacterized protein n=1 Tax=Petromyces alliaceus TaxID=209559 RepID=A0A5N7CGS7_PETAA|nr:hypothetical protein BDV23DRAFT_180733 [Aspergillus alliaceus]